MLLSEFDFILPEHLIAQTPLKKRDTSKLLVVDRQKENYTDHHFHQIINYLNKGDILVRNNTKVIPARLFGIKEITNGHCEVLLLKDLGDDCWECLVGNAKIIKVDTIVNFKEGLLKAQCIEVKKEGIRIFKMIYEGILFEILDQLGTMPLPPYIKEKLTDSTRYNTIYAKVEGSAAAPTAGLHFTKELEKQLIDKGIEIVDVTLHVGLGTFRPVKEDNVLNHHMHSEFYMLSKEAADKLNQAKENKQRIISVGTTSTRVLESVYLKYGKFKETSENTNIFIYPGFQFQAIDGLITNFHLPKSTLLMLISAFSSKKLMLEAYHHAIEKEYRFFSFGDSMLII
jgi:S-adenosylmethionine:tRNA ribosyltransferase-isomerase